LSLIVYSRLRHRGRAEGSTIALALDCTRRTRLKPDQRMRRSSSALTHAHRQHDRIGGRGVGGGAGLQELYESPAPALAPGWQGVRIGHHWRLLVPLAGPVRLRFIVNTSACCPRPDRGCGEPSCSSALSARLATLSLARDPRPDARSAPPCCASWLGPGTRGRTRATGAGSPSSSREA
jgi:hypothetical protein